MLAPQNKEVNFLPKPEIAGREKQVKWMSKSWIKIVNVNGLVKIKSHDFNNHSYDLCMFKLLSIIYCYLSVC